MAEFDIVDLTVVDEPQGTPSSKGTTAGQGATSLLGRVDTSVVAAELESLRKDLSGHVKPDDGGLRLQSVTIRLSVSAEGKVAFVAKGGIDASIEVVFAPTKQK